MTGSRRAAAAMTMIQTSPHRNASAQAQRTIEIVPVGRLANQMFQYMFASALAKAIGGADIIGQHLPDWGLERAASSGAGARPLGPQLVLRGHRHDLRRVAQDVSRRRITRIRLEGVGCWLGYHARARRQWATTFTPASEHDFGRHGDDELVVHVRAGDILDGSHRDYMPTPIALIREVARVTGLKVVFIGQLDEGAYCTRLRHAFPDAVFTAPRTAMADFQTLRHSRHLLASVSTFAWLAAWLSDEARQIHLPLLGLLNPLQRRDVDLVPIGDARYRFYRFPVTRYSGELADLEHLGFHRAGSVELRAVKTVVAACNGVKDSVSRLGSVLR